MGGLAMLYLRAALGGIGKFLSGLTFWQIVSLGLALFAGLQTIRLSAEQRHNHKVEQQLQKAVAELKRITSAKNDQATKTSDNIRVVTKVVHDADERAKQVEQAPVAKECRTKPEVLSADI